MILRNVQLVSEGYLADSVKFETAFQKLIRNPGMVRQTTLIALSCRDIINIVSI